MRPSTSDRLETAFAEAVAEGDFEAAQGWLAAARYVHEREAERLARKVQRPVRQRTSR